MHLFSWQVHKGKKGIAQIYYYELSPTDAKTHWWYGTESHIVKLISRWCEYI